jgi:branched-chain amino acid transport system substrate-binding protein
MLKGIGRGLIAAVAVLGIARPGLAADPGLTDTEIVIGLFGPLSGPLVGYGLDPVNAAKMWYDDINKKGGIHGRKIRLVIEDDKCTANDLVALKKLVTSTTCSCCTAAHAPPR